jgi:hypothetical protein
VGVGSRNHRLPENASKCQFCHVVTCE